MLIIAPRNPNKRDHENICKNQNIKPENLSDDRSKTMGEKHKKNKYNRSNSMLLMLIKS